MPLARRKEVPKPPKAPKAAVKKAYVEGILQDDGTLVYPNTVQLAKQFGPTRETISRWINNEGWASERAIYQERLAEAAEVRKAKMLPNAPGVEVTARELKEDLKAQGVTVEPAGESDPGTVPDFRMHVIAGERAKFDTTCLTLAKALQAEVAVTITRSRKKVPDVATGTAVEPIPLAPKELLSLAGTLERSQRIGRLALGQTTENQGHSSPDGGPIAVDAEHTVDVKKSGYAQMDPAELARLYAETVRAGPADGGGQEAPGADVGARKK